MISFLISKNVGQVRTLIQLIQERSNIQSLAGEQVREKFARYNLELEEVSIGTPASSAGDQKIEQILTQLRSRQIAEEQIETYNRQEKASVKERELREAESRAPAASLDRVGDQHHRLGQPGQGRLSVRAPAGGHYSGAGRGRS